jgi:hypothetical protein
MVRAEIGERTICERSVIDESEKLGILGASNFEAAIEPPTTAIKATV